MASTGIYSPYTFGQLAALGFTERRGRTPDLHTPYRAYDNTEYDAWTMLPDLADDEREEHVYLRRVEIMLEGRGGADVETFHKLLHGTARNVAQVA